MSGYVYDLREYDKVMDGIDARLKQGVLNGLLNAADRLKNDIVVNLISAQTPPPDDRGTYRAGWRTGPLPKGAMLYNATKQADFIEYGVRPENVKVGRKMIDALTEWVKRKGFAPRAKSTSKPRQFRAPKPGKPVRTPQDPARGMAWAIAMNMKKKGIFNRPGPGLGILKLALVNAPTYAKEEVADAIARIMRKK